VRTGVRAGVDTIDRGCNSDAVVELAIVKLSKDHISSSRGDRTARDLPLPKLDAAELKKATR
jgi:hypothetical protein